MPAPAAVSPMTLTGTATFRGEPVANYAVTVLDATTGEPVALRDDLTGATGLAVLNRHLKTDAQGKFSLQVVGLAAGKALRVQVAAGNGRLESVVTANGQALGAKGYRVAQADTAFSVTELTTAIAQIAGNVIRSTQVLTPEAAAPVIAKLATEMAALTAKLEVTLAGNPNAANQLVSIEGKTAEETVKGLVANAGALKGLTETVAALVADIAKAMGTGASPAASDAKVREALAEIRYTGTVLVGSVTSNSIQLLNTINGQRIDANGGTLGAVTTQVTPTSGSSGGASVNWVNVANLTELNAALAGTATHIRLTGDLESVSGYRVLAPADITIGRAVTIDGAGHAVYASMVITTGGVTLSNATIYVEVYVNATTEPGSKVSFNNVTMDEVSLVANVGVVSVTNGTFKVAGDPGIRVPGGATLSVTESSTFTAKEAGVGIGIDAANANQQLTVTGNTFNHLSSGISFWYSASLTPVITGNTFKAGNSGSDGIRVNDNTGPEPSVALRATLLNDSTNTFVGYNAGNRVSIYSP
ncbi:hypothetical protein D3C72_852520 [compost metagenome]